ncbi:uncharacterized protein LOC122129102 [Clupea harengus]|uniref:Uncharacterized protein LOC122129102 n=1 Tax=Clupea harengus TaxID=7950 RepID=A0A8M1KCS2_CLUHA|nr:uncharacterized protein LOC122129102 [Clupea harengus]
MGFENGMERMRGRKKKRGKKLMKTKSQAPFGPCKFVCDLLMVNPVKCATKNGQTNQQKPLVTETYLRGKDSKASRPSESQLGNPSADKSASILKISVDLWPVLATAIEPLKVDQTEISYDDLKNGDVGLGQMSTDKQRTVRSIPVAKLHPLECKSIKSDGHILLPPLNSSIIQPFNSDKYFKQYSSLSPIAVSEKCPVDFAHAESKLEEDHEEPEPRFLKTDSVRNILTLNMASQLQLPDISVPNIQMLLERVDRQLDRGKVKLPEIKLPQAQGEKAEMSARKSCSPPLHGKNMNQPIILRFHKKTHNFPWFVNTSNLQGTYKYTHQQHKNT